MSNGLDTELHHSPDDGDRDGPRNVGDFKTTDMADSPRRLH
jgi:hypothetical protein